MRHRNPDAEPRTPAVLALLAIGALSLVHPATISAGPRWVVFAALVILLIPFVVTHASGHDDMNRILLSFAGTVVMLSLLSSMALLLRELTRHRVEPIVMLQSAAALWITNILVFALWYWMLDAGGPHGRDARDGHTDGAFLFPQMTMHWARDHEWSPNFVDYLFLAFNTSSALSPADTQALSRWAKLLMMIQALISVTILVLFTAKAVNIL